MLTFIPDTHQYFYAGRAVPSVTQILQAEGFIDTTWYQDSGRERGTFVHKTIELFDLCDLDESDLDPGLSPYLEAWKRFLKDTGFQIREIEKEVFDQSMWYAGRLDRTGVMGTGKTAFVDVKSGHMESWVGLQLAAYCMPFPNYYGFERYGVQLKADGKYSLKQFKDTSDFGIWRAAVSCYWWKRNNLKAAR